jgi:hypothetical protein
MTNCDRSELDESKFTEDELFVIKRSLDNCSDKPVVTAKYVIEVVMNEDQLNDDKRHVELFAEEFQRALDSSFFEDLRYDTLTFQVTDRKVLHIANPNYEEEVVVESRKLKIHYLDKYDNDVVIVVDVAEYKNAIEKFEGKELDKAIGSIIEVSYPNPRVSQLDDCDLFVSSYDIVVGIVNKQDLLNELNEISR